MSLKVNPIYRNLQHVPRIWGLSFIKLFSVIFGGIVVLFIMLESCGAAVAFPITLLAVGGGYGVCYYFDNRPADRLDVRFLRDRWTSYTLSLQRIRLK